MQMSKLIISFNLFVFLCLNIIAQNDSLSNLNKKDAVNVYLDFYDNKQYLKDKITYVNYVRDTRTAEVHILQTKQNAGNGGKEYSYIFTGNMRFKNKNDTLSFYTTADNTNDEIRKKQLKILKIGLMTYVAHTPYADKINISFSEDSLSAQNPVDKWRNWVFNLSAYANTTADDSYVNYNASAGVGLNKVTQKNKIEIDYTNYYNLSIFYLEDDTVRSERETNYFRTLFAKSIGEHWALGFNADFGNSTYNNKKIFTGFWPTVEYNIFPYSKSNVIQLRLQYLIGPKYYKYYDTTIYNKTEQFFNHQKLAIAFRINKKWGYINTSISGQHLFFDFSKNRLNINNSLNIRVFKGLSVSFNGNFSIIHDQIFLPKNTMSYEEILLRQQQASTNYSYWLSMGLSYTFGSIYNNVVNPRFNSIY